MRYWELYINLHEKEKILTVFKPSNYFVCNCLFTLYLGPGPQGLGNMGMGMPGMGMGLGLQNAMGRFGLPGMPQQGGSPVILVSNLDEDHVRILRQLPIAS